MSDKYTKARFWKCALQVNPSGYIAYRGQDHGMTEEKYNLELLRICKEENIKVLGIADHGNVDSVDPIRNLMTENDIIVFPGFEIASSEKVHFVCLFREDTTKDQLNRYLGNLELLNAESGIRPSKLSGEQLLGKVRETGGFIYAAHCTEDSGVLFRKLNQIWQNVNLKAVQIPATLDDLQTGAGQAFYQILLNKDPNYKRELPVAIINARDVALPEDLRNPGASCLIKMTKPCFSSFMQAFLDPTSRIRLNFDVIEKYYSLIESIKITGGYLDGVAIDFSEHLNAVIGGRGTGKSTLIECIRYALEKSPTGKNASKQHADIIKENLGKEGGRIEISVRSSTMNGKRFVISRRYGESAIVKDEQGKISTFTPSDLLPRVEIYGQNEIYEIAQDQQDQLKLLKRFLDIDNHTLEKQMMELYAKLEKNRSSVLEAQGNLAEVESEVGKLPRLQEEVSQFKRLQLEEKLKIVPLLEQEKRLEQRTDEELDQLWSALVSLKEQLPDTVFLGEDALKELPRSDMLNKIKIFLDDLKKNLLPLITQSETFISNTRTEINKIREELVTAIKGVEDSLTKTFKEIPSCEGRSGMEIGRQFQSLLKEIERIRPKEVLLKNRRAALDELRKVRVSLLAELSEARAERSAQIQRALKRLNNKMKGKLKLTVTPEANRKPLFDFFIECNMEGIGAKRLAWIDSADDFSPVKLSELIKKGPDELLKTNWGITPTVADALIRLNSFQIMQLEEIKLKDEIAIELNIAHQGKENYRLMSKLSTGQQCTAVLHLLLLENLDPLIMDQPEDNLDNAFIADRIVTELRSAKIARQFLFATHNANIPVFGDAEWIGVFHAEENHTMLPPESQGAIDLPAIQQDAAEILEGGRMAFNQRKQKYGF